MVHFLCCAGNEDTPVDYFMAKDILAKLTETAERGLLGSLKGEAGTWERLIKAYEANCTFLCPHLTYAYCSPTT